MPFDITFFRFLNSLAGANKAFDILVVFFASYAPYLIALAFAALIVLEPNWRKRLYDTAFVALTLLLARGLITVAIRFFYNRPRPFVALQGVTQLIAKDAGAPSFPSGHAVFFFAFVAAYYMLGAHSRWGHVLLAGTILMGLARVVAGVHYPLDILGGAVIGLGSAAVIQRLLPKRTSGDEAKRV
ncbi:MAG: phosphatase PAP2 family protein [Candidatus Harrisonbacteria bacterium]|nr:phosphatase PAP2 family protein [Candidatus Harrisonbacteria bacterium]